MELVFDDEAIADLETSIAGSHRTVLQLPRSTSAAFQWRRAVDHPSRSEGIAGREPDTFEWVVPRLPYVVIYQVDRVRERIVVTAVLHGAQDRES
jgi:plasmid stabilization system protein ParE